MKSMRLAVLVTGLALSAASVSRASSSPALTASNPTATVHRLAAAYNARSVPGVDALLSADYRFHFSGSDLAGSAYTQGLTRELEMRSTAALFAFPVADSSIHRPQIASMNVTVGAIDEGIDPEHPDSTCQYRIAIAHDFRIRLVFTNGDSASAKPALQVFHVVRGDAAVRENGQSADTTRWYIRRWLEDLDAVTIALGSIDGECDGGAIVNAALSAVPTGVALRAVTAPLCSTLKVLCDLPGTEPAQLEVFDVQGRRLTQRSVTPQSSGSVLVEAGNGRRFEPGAYWVRLSQARRAPVTRLVMVAR